MQIKIKLTDNEYKAIADHVISVEDWIQTAAKEKAYKCTERIVAKETHRLLNDPKINTMPATQDTLLDSYFNQSDYKTRAELEASGSV